MPKMYGAPETDTMGYYDLTKEQRLQKNTGILQAIARALQADDAECVAVYFSDPDTYIRKVAYQVTGKLWQSGGEGTKSLVIAMLCKLMDHENAHVRQTVINACGVIAIKDFVVVEHLFERGLRDKRHEVKNAVQGALKHAGERNPAGVVPFCAKHIRDEDPEVRRQALHGMELRGRKHPEDILPVLRLLQFETHRRVRPMLVHVMGQISYKDGCLEKVARELACWDDKQLSDECFAAILEQNRHANAHYRTVKTLSPQACAEIIRRYRTE